MNSHCSSFNPNAATNIHIQHKNNSNKTSLLQKHQKRRPLNTTIGFKNKSCT